MEKNFTPGTGPDISTKFTQLFDTMKKEGYTPSTEQLRQIVLSRSKYNESEKPTYKNSPLFKLIYEIEVRKMTVGSFVGTQLVEQKAHPNAVNRALADLQIPGNILMDFKALPNDAKELAKISQFEVSPAFKLEQTKSK